MTEPTTEAGKRLLSVISGMDPQGLYPPNPADLILAIEAEARESVGRITEDDLLPRLLRAWRHTKDFLGDRLVNSGRSDVNINAVLREMNSAFDGAESVPGDDLGAAWAEAEAALPGVGGWHVEMVASWRRDEWRASAVPTPHSERRGNGSMWLGIVGEGPTPAAALRALAAALNRRQDDPVKEEK